jgi:hypothetical protein
MSLLELPLDLLWTIIGFLDMRSLCTARIVCRCFCQSASSHLKALQLDCAALEQHPTAIFTRFSGLTRLEVAVHRESDLKLLAHPGIGPAVTHIKVWRFPPRGGQNTDDLAHLGLLPKLHSLLVNGVESDLANIELLPNGLEELTINDPYPWPPDKGLKDASPLTQFSNLTSVRIGMAEGDGQSVRSLTSLRNLRSLCLGNFSAAGVLSTFTMLTSLTWICDPRVDRWSIFNDLSRLTQLSKLKVDAGFHEVAHEDLACVAQLTELTCLIMCNSWLPEWVPGSCPLSPLTRLASLGLYGLAGGVPLLASLNLEGLRSLKLGQVEGDTSVLRRATGLTQLEFESYDSVSIRGLGATLRRMSDLRSLSLSVHVAPGTKPFRLGHALKPLRHLTKLAYTGHFEVDGDITACTSLPSLRSLGLNASTITPACLPSLQAMPGLTQLALWSIRKAEVSPNMIEAFDAERLRRGWPRLKLCWQVKPDAERETVSYVYDQATQSVRLIN